MTTKLNVGTVTGVTWALPETADPEKQVAELAYQMRVKLGTWRAVSKALAPYYDASAGLWWKIANGSSHNIDALNAILAYNGLPRIPAPIPVAPCPDCGNAHTGRCYGKPIAAVAILAPGEAVAPIERIRPERKPKPAWLVDATTFLIERRKAINASNQNQTQGVQAVK